MSSKDTDGALLALRAALDLAAPAAAYRSIVDAGPDIGPLLERFRASSRRIKALEPCVERLLAGYSDSAGRSARALAAAASLSRRELEILTLIDDGRSNKEVARALGVTSETEKTHLKHVFGKPSVDRAPQAGRRSRRLGLL